MGLTIAASLFTTASFGQYGDFTIGSSMIPASINLGDTAEYQLQIANLGATDYTANALIATIQAPLDGKVIGFWPGAETEGWTIVSISTTSYPGGGGTTVKLINTHALAADQVTMPSLKIVGVASGTQVNNQTTEHIGFNPGNGTVNYAVQGNLDPTNDNSGTALEVITNPLPIHFVDINAAWKGNDGIVKWTVAQEVNNKYFSIERSFDGKNFKEVGQVNSIGNHQDRHVYTYVDANVKGQTSEKVFYRVKQIDMDGSSTSTSIVSLSTDESGADAYIFPNPVANDHFSFVYQNSNIQDAVLQIQILDAHGRVLVNTSKNITKGKNQIELSTSGMATGTYYLNYTNAENNIKGTLRLVKN